MGGFYMHGMDSTPYGRPSRKASLLPSKYIWMRIVPADLRLTGGDLVSIDQADRRVPAGHEKDGRRGLFGQLRQAGRDGRGRHQHRRQHLLRADRKAGRRRWCGEPFAKGDVQHRSDTMWGWWKRYSRLPIQSAMLALAFMPMLPKPASARRHSRAIRAL